MGELVALEAIGKAVGIPADQVDAKLNSWPGVFIDGNGRLVGFWGVPDVPFGYDVIESFCHRVLFFFASEETGNEWIAGHEDIRTDVTLEHQLIHSPGTAESVSGGNS